MMQRVLSEANHSHFGPSQSFVQTIFRPHFLEKRATPKNLVAIRFHRREKTEKIRGQSFSLCNGSFFPFCTISSSSKQRMGNQRSSNFLSSLSRRRNLCEMFEKY